MKSLVCAPMTAATRPGAERILAAFLGGDTHYLDSSSAYGDGGPAALSAALDLFLERPEIGFVYTASLEDSVVGACVVCYAISTSRGGVVVKLDDVCIAPGREGQGIGGAMLTALKAYLLDRGISRIDCGCHRDNEGAWRFYERHGFTPLNEERIACLLTG